MQRNSHTLGMCMYSEKYLLMSHMLIKLVSHKPVLLTCPASLHTLNTVSTLYVYYFFFLLCHTSQVNLVNILGLTNEGRE